MGPETAAIVAFIAIAVSIFCGVIGFLYFLWRSRRHFIRSSANKLANRVGGITVPQSRHPTVRFGSRDWDCQVEFIDSKNRFGSDDQPLMVKFTTFWPDSDLRINITRQSSFVKKMFAGIDDIEVGNWRFDYNYSLQSNTPDRAKAKINAAVAMQVRELNRGVAAFDRTKPTLQQITTANHSFVTTVSMALSERGIDKLLEDMVGLVELLAGPAPAMQFLEPSDNGIELQSCLNRGLEADCLVCGNKIFGESFRSCAKCLTPHHNDCWEYIGCCSIYGCGSKVAKQN